MPMQPTLRVVWHEGVTGCDWQWVSVVVGRMFVYDVCVRCEERAQRPGQDQSENENDACIRLPACLLQVDDHTLVISMAYIEYAMP
jgi:hypothetical protein